MPAFPGNFVSCVQSRIIASLFARRPRTLGRCLHRYATRGLLGYARARIRDMNLYILTCKSHHWLLPAVEAALKGADLSAGNDVSRLLRGIRGPGGRPISEDEAIVAFNALCDLGVLERSGPRYVLNR